MRPSLRAADPRLLLAAFVLSLSLGGCDLFEKSKKPLPGERVAVFPERGDIQPDKDAAARDVLLPGPVVNDSWPESGGFANYAMQHLAINDSPQVIWTADVGAGSSTSNRVLTTPPVVAEGKVFAKDALGTVTAYRADTGERLWSVTLKPEKARDSDEFGGGLSWYGGRLFVTTGFAQVFALDPANGQEIWNSSTSAPVRGAPLVFGDRVMAVAIDNKLQAFAAVDGADLWSFSGLNEGTAYVAGSSPAGSGEFVVAPFSSGELVNVRLANGRVVWNESLVGSRRESRASGALTDIRGRPVIDRGLVLAMGSAGQIAAFELTSGQHKWERSIGGSQTPWVAGHWVFVVSNSADVIAISRDDGKVKWATPLTLYLDDKFQKPVTWAGPVLAGDRLLVGGSTGELLAISPYDGKILGKMDMKSPIRLAPVIANRTIYVLTDTGRLVALR